MEALYPIGALVFGFIFVNAIHVYSVSIVSTLLGYAPMEISIGFGKELLGFSFGKTRFRIGIILLGGYNTYDEDTHDELAKDATTDLKSFRFAPWYKKLIAHLTGPLACILFAFAVMGMFAIDETVKTWFQLYWLLTDYSASFDFYNIISEIYNDSGLVVLTAMISAKAAGFNLLPLQLLSGGGVISALREAIIGQEISQKTQDIIATISVTLLLTIVSVFFIRAIL